MKVTIDKDEERKEKTNRYIQKRRQYKNSGSWGIIWRVLVVCICIDGPIWAYFHFVENVTVWEGLQNIRRKIHGTQPRVVYKEVKVSPPKVDPQRSQMQKPTETYKPIQEAQRPSQIMTDQSEYDYIMAVNLMKNNRVPEAIEYYRKAARAGNIKAQRDLAELATKVDWKPKL